MLLCWVESEIVTDYGVGLILLVCVTEEYIVCLCGVIYLVVIFAARGKGYDGNTHRQYGFPIFHCHKRT